MLHKILDRAMRVTIPPDSLIENFAAMVNCKTYADVNFIVQGKPIFAHKFMLAFRCPFLYGLLGKNITNVEIEELSLPTITYDIFILLMKYIYCGNIILPPDIFAEVMQAAIELHLPNLVNACREHAKSVEAAAILHIREPLVAELSDLVDNERLSDVVFIVEGKRVHGHRLIMAVQSNYFRSVLTTGLKESGQSEITIQEVSHAAFLVVLAFVYTGQVGLVTEENAVDVLEAANYFSEQRLKCVCEDVLKNGMDLDNVSYLLRVSVRFEAAQLRRVCTETIIQNFDAVAQAKTFGELDRELLVETMSEACKRLKRTLPTK